MIIVLTEKDVDGGGSTWEIGVTPNLPKDGTEAEQEKWDAGRVGMILMNHGLEMMSQYYKSTKAERSRTKPSPLVAPTAEDIARLGRRPPGGMG